MKNSLKIFSNYTKLVCVASEPISNLGTCRMNNEISYFYAGCANFF